MSRYRKYVVALIGVLLQILGLLATAADTDLLPPSWRPWGVVVIALATAFGVRRFPNDDPAPAALEHDGRHEA